MSPTWAGWSSLTWRGRTTPRDRSCSRLTNSPEQRFFVGYGQSWCSNEREENKRLRATVDPHSPEKYRTNGVVSNMPEFQEAFHCKPQSAMVNQNRCRVW